MATCTQKWSSDPDVWVLTLKYFPEMYGGCLAATNTAGGLSLYSPNHTSPICTAPSMTVTVNAMAKASEQTLVTAASNGVRLWDLRNKLEKPIAEFTSPHSLNYLSVATKDEYTVAAGAELVGSEASVQLWDSRNPGQVLRRLTESHRDDVTALEFHPERNYLMSGSTDGCVNVYDLNIAEEDDSYYQSVPFSSVHLCHFLRPDRIAVLSHIETLGFFQLDDDDYSKSALPDEDLGDVRNRFNKCEYVVDLYSDHIVYGSNAHLSLFFLPFDPVTEKFNNSALIDFPGAHGEEVVRDFCKIPEANVAFSGGEDGLIKCWTWDMPMEGSNNNLKRQISDSATEGNKRLKSDTSSSERPKNSKKSSKLKSKTGKDKK